METDVVSRGVFVIFFGCIQLGYSDDASQWRSGPPDGLPKMTSFDVECGKEDMTVHLEFNLPYDGSVYSKGGAEGKCMHVSPLSHVTEATFTIGYDSCGTRSDSNGKFYENTIILQYDYDVIEAWDEARKIRCEWHDGYEKSAYKTPITISDLDVVEMNFQGDDIDCWLEIQDGKGPWSSKVSGLVPLGSPLTLVVAIQDEEGHFDMRVKECKAHDGNRNPVYLTDEEGCVLRPKMMSPFRKTKDPKDGATVIAYSHFYAFKFPDTVDVHVQCTVEICRHGCSEECTQSRDTSSLPEKSNRPPLIVAHPADVEDSGDIPTYHDSYQNLALIASKPGNNSNTDQYLPRHGISTNGTKPIDISIVSDKAVATKPSKDSISENPSHILPNFMRHANPEDLLDVFRERHDADSPDYIPLGEKRLPYPSVAQEPDYYDDLDLFKEVFGDGKGFEIDHASERLANNAENTTYEATKTEDDTQNHSEPPAVSSVTYENGDPNDQFEKRVSVYLEQNGTEVNKQEGGSDTHPSNHQNKEAQDLEVIEVPLQQDVNAAKSKPDVQMGTDNNYEQYTSQDEAYANADTNQNLNEHEFIKPEYESYSGDKLIEVFDTDSGLNENPEISDYYESVPDYDLRKKNDDTGLKKHMQNTEYDYYVEKYPNEARKYTKSGPRNRNVIGYSTFQKPYRPPVPVAPLTLYNGVPLHYYKEKSNFLNRDKYRYVMHPPQSLHPRHGHDLHISYRMGKRRKRREIGDREQLGLQQTFQVIAPIDLAFTAKHDDTSLYVGRQYEDGEVCMASTSFAAGLGLMVLANVCVLCVVIFFSHHYYMNYRGKSNVTFLLALRNLLHF